MHDDFLGIRNPRRIIRALMSTRILCLLAVAITTAFAPAQGNPPYQPHVEPASDAPQRAMAGLKAPPGTKVELIAAEPMLSNPVAFEIGDDGRIRVVETHRLKAGVIDMREYKDWVDEDLACRTVEDRRAAILRHFPGDLPAWRAQHERVRCLIDDDHDGKIDRALTFADGFNDLVDGIAAGVVSRGADVWFTDIPNLWKLTDADGDGVAEKREVLSTGYGVHFSLIGHDMHGAIIGPDMRLWFSIGDRGFSVPQLGGERLDYPDEGAVLSCELDGTDLRVVHRGLRNPQELAFDDFGDLFTGDNNSDGGDEARLVQVVEGGNSGWGIGYQWLSTRGAWNEDLLWKPRFDGQPAWICPPIANIAHGPSGLAINPGTGLPSRFDGRFFLCDFRGSPPHSGVLALQVERDGAGFKLLGSEPFLWNLCATDCAFGPDGGLYVLDWVDGWDLTGRGRIYRVVGDDLDHDALAQETSRMLREGTAKVGIEELVARLQHRDRRVRLAAQFELVGRGQDGIAALDKVSREGQSLIARIHAIWGLGIVARRTDPAIAGRIERLLFDGSDEIRAQTLRVLSDRTSPTTRLAAEKLCRDPSPRVRFFAAQALGAAQDPLAIAPLFELLRRNADEDAMVRHAAVVALERCHAANRFEDIRNDTSPAVRRGMVLVLRRLRDPRIAEYLDDKDPSIAAEAARAIHDQRIEGALPALAAWTKRKDLTDIALIRRVLGACRILGTTQALDALLNYAQRADVPAAMRVEALQIAGEWPRPHGQDRVLGLWRPLAARPALVARAVIGATLTALQASPDTPDAVLDAAIDAARNLRGHDLAATLTAISNDAKRGAATRARALDAIAEVCDTKEQVDAARAVSPEAPIALRRAARDILAKHDPAAVVDLLASLAKDGNLAERRAAIENLARVDAPAADKALTLLIEQLGENKLPAELGLDALEAGLGRSSGTARAAADRWLERARTSNDALAAFRVCESGGDQAKGSEVFRSHAAAQCVRCHTLEGQGGTIGPVLDGIGKRRDRSYLLTALVDPAHDIAEGYAQTVITRTDGSTAAGILLREDAQHVVLRDADGKDVDVPVAAIRTRATSGSAMPKMDALLSRREIRDVVEFLATRK